MGRRPLPTTVTVRTITGRQKAYGLIYRLTTSGAQIATSVPLTVGDTLRFRLLHHDSLQTTERFGRVLRLDVPADRTAHLVSECRVQWLSPSEAVGLGVVGRETAREA